MVELCRDCKRPVGIGLAYVMDGQGTLCMVCYGRKINPPEPEVIVNPAPKVKRERKPRAPRVCSMCGEPITGVAYVKQIVGYTCMVCFVRSVAAEAQPKRKKGT